MKKVLLLSLSLVLGFSAIAQQRVMKDDARMAVASSKKALAGKELPGETVATYAPQTAQSYVLNRMLDSLDTETMWTYYDLQSNQYVANRMYQLPNGSVAVTATMSHENNQTASDRGTGYAFYDGAANAWTTIDPENRIESFKTGWPSIAQFGENGEILLAHGNGHMQCFYREVAGEGNWTYVGALPDCPEGYPYAGASDAYPTWPRIVTCGDDHNIAVAVAAIQHSISSDETDIQCVMWRSEDPRDINSWTIDYSPLQDVGWDHNQFSADDYCMAANGHNVALLYSGCLTNSVWMFKSTDDGATWTSTRVWENPYEGREFDEEPAWGMEDTLFMPMNGSVVIDNDGVTHVALNTFEMAHTLDNEPGYYSYWSGRSVDGILYWNDTQVAPIQSPDGNPHHAARLWWPSEEAGYVHMVNDSTRWIGFIPMFYDETGSLTEWNNDMYYMSGSEYISKFYGASGHPALSCDPNGNLACAFSTPCTYRDNGTYYYRSVFVSYRNVEEGYWHQVEDNLINSQMLLYTEALFTNAVPNTINAGEFWFGYQGDDEIGFYWGSNASQAAGTENMIHAYKIVADPEFVNVNEFEAVNPMTNTRVYPNPVTDMLNIEVNASQASEMNISVFNIMGQKVAEENVTISTGLNTNSINTENLSNGIYFVTVKANGFENTMKFIVK